MHWDCCIDWFFPQTHEFSWLFFIRFRSLNPTLLPHWRLKLPAPLKHVFLSRGIFFPVRWSRVNKTLWMWGFIDLRSLGLLGGNPATRAACAPPDAQYWSTHLRPSVHSSLKHCKHPDMCRGQWWCPPDPTKQLIRGAPSAPAVHWSIAGGLRVIESVAVYIRFWCFTLVF